MHIVLYEIFDALTRLGYDPKMNESETGYTFNFNLELAICRFDVDSNLVTFIVPCLHKTVNEDSIEVVRRVNSRNHVGRLVNLDGSAVSAVSSFYVFNDKGVDSQVCFAINDLNRLINDYFTLLLEA